jgi:hypothetical protein
MWDAASARRVVSTQLSLAWDSRWKHLLLFPCGTSHAQRDDMRRLVTLLCVPVLLALSRPAVCAQASRPKPGARIRFDAPSLEGRLAGTLVAWESDTLVVKVDGYSAGLNLLVPVDSVAGLEVRRERRMTLEGLGLGVLAGTLTALAADPNWVDENGNCTTVPCLSYLVSSHLDTRLAVFGISGVLLGTMIGSETKSAKWVPVRLESVSVGPAPGGGLALGVRISF